jgi:hypothetical protein
MYIVHKIIEASFVQNVKVCAVAGLKIDIRQCLDLLLMCRLGTWPTVAVFMITMSYLGLLRAGHGRTCPG